MYLFKNTCGKCFNDIEIPLLGDMAYGEIEIQSEDGKVFQIATLIENETFDFIQRELERLNDTKTDAQKILATVADPINGKKFLVGFVCPNCLSPLNRITDNNRTETIQVNEATWKQFDLLTDNEKMDKIKALSNKS